MNARLPCDACSAPGSPMPDGTTRCAGCDTPAKVAARASLWDEFVDRLANVIRLGDRVWFVGCPSIGVGEVRTFHAATVHPVPTITVRFASGEEITARASRFDVVPVWETDPETRAALRGECV